MLRANLNKPPQCKASAAPAAARPAQLKPLACAFSLHDSLNSHSTVVESLAGLQNIILTAPVVNIGKKLLFFKNPLACPTLPVRPWWFLLVFTGFIV
jgi:hypothetical protein